MSYSEYMSFILGLIFALVAGVVVGVVAFLRSKKMKDAAVEWDERTIQVRSNAGQWSFFITLAASFVAWVASNVQAHNEGAEIQFFSPWGVMFWSMLVIYGVSYAYFNYMSSESLLDGDWKRHRLKGSVLMLMGVGLAMWFINHQMPFFTYVSMGVILCAIFFLTLAIRGRVQATKGTKEVKQ